MKKQVLGLAVASALSAPAVAQNVSVYGILDANVSSQDLGAISKTVMSSGLMQSSRLGFQGSEDLGGGLKGFFKLEGRLAFDTGALGTTSVDSTSGTTTTGNNIFNRDAFVGISGGFGSVQLGLMATDTNIAIGAGNATGFNIGDSNATFSSSLYALGDRVSNAVRYTTPTFAGFSASVTGINGENTTTTTKDSSRDGFGGSVNYASGPLKLAAALMSRNAPLGSTAAPKDTVVAATYDLGVAAIGAYSYTTDASRNAANNKLKVNTLTAKAPLSNGMSLVGAYHDLKGDSGAGTSKIGNGKAVIFGLTQDLSKRTMVYAIYGTQNNDSSASFNSPFGQPVTAAGQDASGYAFGVRHSF